MNAGNQPMNWLNIGLSCVTHLLLLAPAIYIVTLCVQLNYSLFLWHPTCMAVGCGLLMTEAILSVSGEAFLSSMLSRTGRIKFHWILHVLGLSLMVVGFSVIIANKNINGASHFTSDHGKLGLSTVIISLIVGLCGFSTLFAGLISTKLSLGSVKLIHACCGIICMILVLASLITGTYRGWWPGSNVGRGLAVAAYIIAGFILLLKPIYSSLLRIRVLFN